MHSFLDTFRLNLRYAFRPKKPLLTARLAKAVVRSYLLRKPPLRYVDFAIGFACNLACEHCFATALKHPERKKMEVADYARVAEQSMALGCVNFSFQGGEPLLMPRLYDIIKACKPDRNVISVTTNGTLLDAETICRLKSAGVDILTVSLDSCLPEEHDGFRGMQGAQAKTLEGVDLALNAGLRVTLGAVVTHQNLRTPGITGLAELAARKKVLLYYILPVPAGKWAENKDMLLDADDLAYIEALVQRSPYIRTDFKANFGPEGCGAAKEILYLTPYGDVLACPFMHIAFGNVLHEDVAGIRMRMLENPYLATYHDKCLVSTDAEFIERYLSKTFGRKDLPLAAEEVFEGQQPHKEGL